MAFNNLPGWNFKSVNTTGYPSKGGGFPDNPGLPGKHTVEVGTGVVRGELDGFEYKPLHSIDWSARMKLMPLDNGDWSNHRNGLGPAYAQWLPSEKGQDMRWLIAWSNVFEMGNKAGAIKPFMKKMTPEEVEKVRSG